MGRVGGVSWHVVTSALLTKMAVVLLYNTKHRKCFFFLTLLLFIKITLLKCNKSERKFTAWRVV